MLISVVGSGFLLCCCGFVFFQTVGDSFCNNGFYAVYKIQNKL